MDRCLARGEAHGVEWGQRLDPLHQGPPQRSLPWRAEPSFVGRREHRGGQQLRSYIENRRETELHKVIKDQGMKKWLNKAFQDTAMGTQHPEPQGYMQPQSDPALMCWSRMVSLCASISRPTGRLSALWTRTPPPMSSRRWHGSDSGATNVSAEHLPRGGHRLGLNSRIFGSCATLAALARSGDGEPNSTARGLDKSFDPACMTPPAVPSCAMKRVAFAAQWGVH